MEFMPETQSLPMNKFNKCGELYRSPKINDKQYMFLSCVYCKDISWELDAFFQHLDTTHHIINDICLNYYKEDGIVVENSPVFKNAEYRNEKPITISNCENDPLDENNCDYNDLLPVAVKIEKDKSIERNIKFKINTEIIGRECSSISELPEINNYKNKNNDNTSVDEYEADKIPTEEENGAAGEYLKEKYKEDYDGSDDADTIIVRESRLDKDNKKPSLKHLTKNREFITSVIKAYQKQTILWKSAYKSRKSNAAEKQEALKAILKEIQKNFTITATQQQIERIIKRLKLKFAHYLRTRNKGDAFKPLWFFEQLTFLEPHLNRNNLKNGICRQLNDNQFLTLITMIKENECFWNENNIYHTSVINKQEILKRMTADFSKICDLKDFTVDIMQNSIEEIIEMAKEENTNKMQYLENDMNDGYQSSNKFYKDILFLLPHVGPFKCKYCSKTFIDIYAYKFHTSRHEGTKPFKCMECPRELTHKKEFVCHLRRHTKECPFQCNVCDKSFPSQKEWHRHVIKHGSKPYVCELCADSFYTQHQLTNHMKNHNNIKDHVCPECGKGFTHRGLLRQHLQTHNKTKCFCRLCDNIYSNPRSLRKHYVRVHESGQQSSATSGAQYNCQICKITFSTIHDAKQHRKEHKQSNPTERKHVCDICGHHFAYPRNLADHKKTHSNIRDQVCDVCGKAFTNANLLNQHKNVHIGEKFVCKACGKDYAHYRGLCRHLSKVHSTNIRDLDSLLEKQKISSSIQ